MPGRNEPCSCGSGLKYKKCCGGVPHSMVYHADGRRSVSYRPIPPKVIAGLQRQEAQEAARRANYGDVRPIICSNVGDHKIVAVGNTIHWSPAWRTFSDFLLDFIKKTLGAEWGNAELKKPLADRHVILQWYDALCRLQAQHPKGADGIASAVPDGPSFAYVLLAYDLYVLRDHGALFSRMVKRLKSPNDFQGARYELAVAATMIRAGFDLGFENEKDNSRKHPEFLATHRVTGQVLAVEAKSRHLPGVLGRAGEPINLERLDIRGLLRNALAKPVQHPYAIFIDANMPPDFARERWREWLGDVDGAVKLHDHGFDELGVRTGSGFNYLLVTNVPHHYGRLGEPAPNPLFYQLKASISRQTLAHPEILDDIERSFQLIDRVPQHFPPDPAEGLP